MSARYIFRLDDITPGMHWGKFWALLSLLRAHNIKPLLGIVPDNQDPSLEVCSPHPDFWGVMRQLQEEDCVDFAQHGYQHTLYPAPDAAMLGPDLGIKEMSEFASFPYEIQRLKIKTGKQILEDNGIHTNAWMAPNHTFDHNTLTALQDEGFRSVTDGISLFPYSEHGLIFIPQQSWEPRWIPCGVLTICLHTNEITPQTVRALRHFLRRPYNFTRFSEEVSKFDSSSTRTMLDSFFYHGYRTLRRLQSRQHDACSRRARLSSPAIDSPLAAGALLSSRQGS
jgi:predicted deacetylase